MIPEPDWKAALRAQFEEALAGLEEPSAFNRDDADQEEVEDAPDIYTFYEALAALRHEVRQGNRKTAEAFSQFGDSLGAFDSELKRWSDASARTSKSNASTASNDTAKSLRLPLVELGDRIHRLRDSFQNPPAAKAGWFGRRIANLWQRAWREREQAIQLLAEQVSALLSAAGLTPIPTKGRPFDPTLMTAIARDESSADGGSLVVVEEITRGYLYQNSILRLAEVRVSRQQPLS